MKTIKEYGFIFSVYRRSGDNSVPDDLVKESIEYMSPSVSYFSATKKAREYAFVLRKSLPSDCYLVFSCIDNMDVIYGPYK